MKRRSFFQALTAVPAATTLLAQQGPRGSASAIEEPKIETVTPAEAGEPVLRFFTPAQFAPLQRLSGLLAPPYNGQPGAVECRVAEFLDFLVGESLPARQQIYREGLDALNAESQKRHQKPFDAISEMQAAAFLEPLRRPWTYELPADPLARFLVTAKADVHTATQNSREFAGSASGGFRRGGGSGLYWNPLD